MTSPTDSFDAEPDPLEALASRHVDGLTTGDEAARVRTDPQLAALAGAMEAVRAALRVDDDGAVVDRREQAVSAALAAFDADGGAAAAPADDPRPVALPVVLAHRRAAQRRRLQLVGAAAAAVLLVVAVPLLSRWRAEDRSSDDVASGLAEDRSQAPTAGVGGGIERDAADAGPEAAPSVAAGDGDGAPVDLGPLDDLDAVVDAVRPLVDDPSAQTSTTTAGDDSSGEGAATSICPPPPDAGTLLLRAVAQLAGRPVLVAVHRRADGERRIVVVDAASCAEVGTRAI